MTGVLYVKWFSSSILDLRLAENVISGMAEQRVVHAPSATSVGVRRGGPSGRGAGPSLREWRLERPSRSQPPSPALTQLLADVVACARLVELRLSAHAGAPKHHRATSSFGDRLVSDAVSQEHVLS